PRAVSRTPPFPPAAGINISTSPAVSSGRFTSAATRQNAGRSANGDGPPAGPRCGAGGVNAPAGTSCAAMIVVCGNASDFKLSHDAAAAMPACPVRPDKKTSTGAISFRTAPHLYVEAISTVPGTAGGKTCTRDLNRQPLAVFTYTSWYPPTCPECVGSEWVPKSPG